MMFFTLCAPDKYKGIPAIHGIPTLENVLEITERFIKELRDIEQDELKLVKENGKLSDYRAFFGEVTIALRAYEGVMGPTVKIVNSLSENKDNPLYNQTKRVLTDLYSGYIKLLSDLKNDFNLDPGEDKELMDSVEDSLGMSHKAK